MKLCGTRSLGSRNQFVLSTGVGKYSTSQSGQVSVSGKSSASQFRQNSGVNTGTSFSRSGKVGVGLWFSHDRHDSKPTIVAPKAMHINVN